MSALVENFKQQFHDSLFFRMVTASIALHLMIVLSFTIRTFVFPNDALDYETAIKVDIVALPEKNQQLPPVIPEEKKQEEPQEKPAVEKPPEKVAPKIPEKPKVDLKAKKKEKSDALAKIKALQALENISDEVKEDDAKKRDEEVKKKQADIKVKGNILSNGGALKGIVSTQLAGYMSQLERHAKEHWTLPQWLADLRPQPRAKAVVFLDESGVVSRRMIVESSGNSTFDELILSAIDRASPFPAPPKHFVDLVKVKGIQLNFPD